MHSVFHWEVPSSPQSAARGPQNIKQRGPLLLGRAGCVLGQGQQRSWEQGKVCSLAAAAGEHCHFFLWLDFSIVLCEEGSWEGREQMAEIPDLP